MAKVIRIWPLVFSSHQLSLNSMPNSVTTTTVTSELFHQDNSFFFFCSFQLSQHTPYFNQQFSYQLLVLLLSIQSSLLHLRLAYVDKPIPACIGGIKIEKITKKQLNHLNLLQHLHRVDYVLDSHALVNIRSKLG